MPRIGIEQPADHPLVLRAVLGGLALEEFDAAPRERDRHLHAFLAESEFFRGRQKVGNDLQLAQRFIGVSDSLGHRQCYQESPVRPYKGMAHKLVRCGHERPGSGADSAE